MTLSSSARQIMSEERKKKVIQKRVVCLKTERKKNKRELKITTIQILRKKETGTKRQTDNNLLRICVCKWVRLPFVVINQ